jgi:phosphopantetheinyl transferase
VFILQHGKITVIFPYMPLIYQHQINENSHMGVWHIAEGEHFFLKRVPLQREITHWHKRLQHLAGRFLLTELVPDFPHELIRIADTRKPFLENEAWHFSLSHCGDYAAAIVSRDKRVGVDVELVSEKVARVKNKFLTEEEMGMVDRGQGEGDSGQGIGDGGQGTENSADHQPSTVNCQPSTIPGHQPLTNFQLSTINFQLLTACWSIKEALFKWKGSGEIDFKKHLRIDRIELKDNEGKAYCRFLKEGEIELTVDFLFFNENCLSWVMS